MIHWADFSYKKTLEFNYHPDLIDDKSIAPSRENWFTSFSAAGFRKNGKRKPRPTGDDASTPKKLIISFLMQSSLDMIEKFQKVRAIRIRPK